MISTRKHLALLHRIHADHARERSEWASERRELLDRIMFLSGRTWEMPPDAKPLRPESDEDLFDESPEEAADQLLSYE